MQQQGQGLPPIQYQVPMPQPPQKSGGFGGGGMGGLVVALLVALAVSYGMLQFMGVPKSELTAFQSTIQSTVNTFSGRITAVEGRSIPPDLSVRMADVEAKVRTVTTVDTSGFVTKAAYDAKVKELEDAIAVLKSGTTTTTDGTTTSTGNYVVTMDKGQIISTSTDTGNKNISVTVKNNTGAYKNPSLLISLVPLSPSAVDRNKIGYGGVATIGTAFYPRAKTTLSGFSDFTNSAVSTNPDVTSLVSKVYWISPNFSLDSGATKSIWTEFDVKSTDVVTWTLEIKVLE